MNNTNTSKLSDETYDKLALALKPEVIKYIESDERYPIFMQELIPDAIRSKLGNMNEEVLGELSLMIMDKTFFR